MESSKPQPKALFSQSISFFKKIGFDVLEYQDENELFNRFQRQAEDRFRQKIESIDTPYFYKELVFEQLGFDARYWIDTDEPAPACSQIWNFYPYIEDSYDDQFAFINGHLERVLGTSLPVTDINYEFEGHAHFLKFKYRDQMVSLKNDHLALLSCDYIQEVTKFSREDPALSNLYILDYSTSETPILFSTSQMGLKAVMEYLEIEESRIS